MTLIIQFKELMVKSHQEGKVDPSLKQIFNKLRGM